MNVFRACVDGGLIITYYSCCAVYVVFIASSIKQVSHNVARLGATYGNVMFRNTLHNNNTASIDKNIVMYSASRMEDGTGCYIQESQKSRSLCTVSIQQCSGSSKQNLCSSHSPTSNSHKRSVPAIALTMNITKPETSVPKTFGTKLSLSHLL